jgi:hypothetical protein
LPRVWFLRQREAFMPRSGKKKGPGPWLRLVVTGLAAVAALAMASSGGSDATVTAGGPSGCVVMRVAP